MNPCDSEQPIPKFGTEGNETEFRTKIPRNGSERSYEPECFSLLRIGSERNSELFYFPGMDRNSAEWLGTENRAFFKQSEFLRNESKVPSGRVPRDNFFLGKLQPYNGVS